MNKQEIFDKVANHLRSMKGPSENESGNCMYRGLNGSMCAMGALIPDEMYDVNMENHTIEYLIENENFSLPEFFSKTNMWFLDDLQYAHDSFQDRENPETTWSEWIEIRLLEVAKKNGVNFIPLE